MQIVIGNILSGDEIALICATLAQARFEDGRETAGFAARLVKNNRQASDRRTETVRKLVQERILAHEVFTLAVRPKALTPVMFSRYESGMHYGSHVDDALMQGMRTDVSFTLFLSEPESYDGGELVVHLGTKPVITKGQAGSVVVYPSTQLHEVTPVRRGQRLVSITFIESLIPDEFLRTQLYELNEVAALEGLKMSWNNRVRLEAVRYNLLRLWSRT